MVISLDEGPDRGVLMAGEHEGNIPGKRQSKERPMLRDPGRDDELRQE